MRDEGPRVQLVGMFRLPSPIVFEGSCAGAVVDTYIGDYDARITLPRLEDRYVGKDGAVHVWNVREPATAVPEHVISAMFEERPDPSTFQVPRWGTVHAHPQDGTAPHFLATDVLIEYEELSPGSVDIEDTARGREIIQDHFVMDFFAQIDPWFERVAGWISVLVDQPLDVAGRLKVSLTEGENLVVVARVGADYTNASHIAWSAPMGRTVEPVSETHLAPRYRTGF